MGLETPEGMPRLRHRAEPRAQVTPARYEPRRAAATGCLFEASSPRGVHATTGARTRKPPPSCRLPSLVPCRGGHGPALPACPASRLVVPGDPCGPGCRTAYRASHASLGPAGASIPIAWTVRAAAGTLASTHPPTHPLQSAGRRRKHTAGSLAARQGAGPGPPAADRSRAADRDAPPGPIPGPAPSAPAYAVAPVRQGIRGALAALDALRRDGADRRRHRNPGDSPRRLKPVSLRSRRGHAAATGR